MAQHISDELKQELASAKSQQLDMARNQVLQLQQAVTQLVSDRDTAVAAATTAKTRYFSLHSVPSCNCVRTACGIAAV